MAQQHCKSVVAVVEQAIAEKTVFNSALVIEQYVGKDGIQHLVICRCLLCGGLSLPKRYGDIQTGRVKSCGCLRKVKTPTKRLPKTDEAQTGEYRIWQHMKRRCDNPRAPYYKRWGGRGIRVCKAYRESMSAFIGDIGHRPTAKHSIDRADNDGHYSCGKCEECVEKGWPFNIRWATAVEQANNRCNSRLVSAGGRTQTIAMWAKETGIGNATIAIRIKKGWSGEDAVTIPVDRGRKHHSRGKRIGGEEE